MEPLLVCTNIDYLKEILMLVINLPTFSDLDKQMQASIDWFQWIYIVPIFVNDESSWK